MATQERKDYARGYAAGRKRLRTIRQAEKQRSAETAFWERAYLVALPACIEAKGWKQGEKPITSLRDRAKLAADFADQAVMLRRSR